MNKTKLLSLIVPLYNEENNLDKLLSELLKEVKKLPVDYEIIFIDNCSTDNSRNILVRELEFNLKLKYIRFSRNFGPSVESSIQAGLNLCMGDAAVVIYSDLQDPPYLIAKFVEKWLDNYDIVYGIQTNRKGEPFWRKSLVTIFYKIMYKISDVPIARNAGDFRLISRRVIDVLANFPEHSRYFRGLTAWVGFKSVGIEYERDPRVAGKSSASFFAIFSTALVAITSFSVKPLRLMILVGMVLVFFTFLSIVALIYNWFNGNSVPGLTSVTVLLLASIAINSLFFGLIGEYLSKVLIESKARPLYVIEEKRNFNTR